MSDSVHDQLEKRGALARSGLVALNLISPGLGLFRLGEWQAGGMCLSALPILMVLTTLGFGHLPLSSFARVIAALLIFLGLVAALYIAASVLTWQRSKFRSPVREWSQWYGPMAIIAITFIALPMFTTFLHTLYKPFYSPAESMAPTIDKGDKFVTDMRWRGPIERGDVLVFRSADGDRIGRVAAVAGDRISMRDGVPILNGVPARQRIQGRKTFTGYDGLQSVVVIEERFPNEASPHRIMDTGPNDFDDAPERTVPANHFFILGDNRDRSADSRVPAELSGVGMVPSSAIIGRPMYIHWSSNRSKIGMRLDQ